MEVLIAILIAFVAGLVFSRIGFFKKLVDKGAEFLAKLK